MLPLPGAWSRSGGLPDIEAEWCWCRWWSMLQLQPAWTSRRKKAFPRSTGDSLTELQRACPNPPGQGLGRGGPVARGGFGGFPRGGFAGGRSATCYKCGGPNHFARDCQAQAVKCYACGKIGHISKDCTAPTGGPLSTAGKSCYQCGELGHISRDCPNKQPANEVIPADVDLNAIPAPVAAPIAPAA